MQSASLIVPAVLLVGIATLSLRAANSAPGTATAPATRPATAPANASARYLELHEINKLRAKKGNVDIVFLGDSITSGWAGMHGRDLWTKHFEPLNAVNFGIGLDTPAKLLWRIQDGTLDGIQPKVVVLLIGTNTLGIHLADSVKRDIDAIRQKLPDAKILLLAVFPRNGASDTPAHQENRIKGNAELAKLDDQKTLFFLDLSDKMAPGGKLDRSYFVSDGIHLNRTGYTLWADSILPRLKTMLEQHSTR